jgi:hypothetical protein
MSLASGRRATPSPTPALPKRKLPIGIQTFRTILENGVKEALGYGL